MNGSLAARRRPAGLCQAARDADRLPGRGSGEPAAFAPAGPGRARRAVRQLPGRRRLRNLLVPARPARRAKGRPARKFTTVVEYYLPYVY